MTREYLYRGKRLGNNQWVYGNLLVPVDGEVKDYYIKPGVSGRRVAVDPNSVGQYTGLHDTQGNRIFEGDILKLTREWESGTVEIWYAQVVFGNQYDIRHWGWQLKWIQGDQVFDRFILEWVCENAKIAELYGNKVRVLSAERVSEELQEAEV